MDAVGECSCHPQHPWANSGNVDRNVRMIDRTGTPSFGQQRERVEIALIVELSTLLERTEDRSQRLHVVAQSGPGWREGSRVSPRHVRFDLRTEAEQEAAAGRFSKLP